MSIYSWLVRKKLRLILVIWALSIIYSGIINRHFPPQAPFDINAAPVLKPDTLIQRTPSEISSHNAIWRAILVERAAMENAGAIARESAKIQTRGFYLAILAALWAFLFRFNDSTSRLSLHAAPTARQFSSFTDLHAKQNVRVILLSLIVVAYALEVHQDDLSNRYRSALNCYGQAINQLSDSTAMASTWQVFDYTKVTQQMNNASDLTVKWPRLLLAAARPTDVQTVLYILPLIAIAVEWFSNRRANSPIKGRRAP